jgi:aminopeptidase N
MSLTLSEARARAAQLSDVAYDLALDLRDPALGGTFGVRCTVSFTSGGPETFLELTAASDVTLEVDGVAREASYDGRRIALTGLGGRHEVTVTARVPYVTDGDGMHFFTDPADGEVYVSAYLGIDITQRVFPCFDQVDLKAPLTLSVVADPAWTVLANGRATSREDGRWTFATTPPIPIDNMVVCAGPWASYTWEHRGLPFGWHARASLAEALDRDAAELRRITETCFDHYGAMFDEPYPYDGYDQAMVPGQNWGAQEMPGCIVYRDEYLPRGPVTEELALHRAMVIAHEMAHMWFGNLVTMRWWEDTWLNESFADYMGYRVAADASGYDGAQVLHEIERKPAAYDADARRSTHPVAPRPEDVPDVDAAFNNFDAISYAKGNSVLRQLVTWLGDADFLRGVNDHLTAHRFGNASLADLVAAWDAVSPRDVRSWAEVWLQRSGCDTIRVERDGDVPVLVREGTRPHRLRVTAYDDAWTPAWSGSVDLDADPVRLDDAAGLVVVPNSHGETFARLRLDERSWAAVVAGLSRVEDDLVRSMLWQTAFELVQSGVLPASSYLDLVGRHLADEPVATIVTSVVRRTVGAVLPRSVAPEHAPIARELLTATCSAGLAAAAGDAARTAFAHAVAAHTRDTDLLGSWLADGRTAEGVEVDPVLRWTAVARLAALGALDADAIEAERAEDGTFAGDLGAARALAARPTEAAKAEAWAVLTDPQVSNRVFEATAAGLWETADPALVAPYVARYLELGPHLAERRGQAFSQTVGRAFPTLRLDDDQLGLLRSALAGPVPAVLRRHWEDALDDRG